MGRMGCRSVASMLSHHDVNEMDGWGPPDYTSHVPRHTVRGLLYFKCVNET